MEKLDNTESNNSFDNKDLEENKTGNEKSIANSCEKDNLPITYKDASGNEILIENYKNKPEDLISTAYSLVRHGKYEDSLELMNAAINLKLDQLKGDKSNIECARFYTIYADILIIKMTETAGLFGFEDNNGNKNKQTRKSNIENDEDEDEDEDEEEATDEEVAYDNLFSAQKIYQEFLRPYNVKLPEDVPEDIKLYYLKLAGVFSLFGELEMVNSASDTKRATNFYEEAIKYYNKYDELYSREKGEVYYKMSMCYDYDPYKNLYCLYLTKIILEYHLQKELDSNSFNTIKVFNPSEEKYLREPNLEERINPEEIDFKKDLEEKLLDNDKTKDLKSILKEIYIKVSKA